MLTFVCYRYIDLDEYLYDTMSEACKISMALRSAENKATPTFYIFELLNFRRRVIDHQMVDLKSFIKYSTLSTFGGFRRFIRTPKFPFLFQVMSEYALLREDLDNLLEMSQWPDRPDPMKSIESKVKASFTRTYNKEVVLPYATNLGSVAKRYEQSVLQDKHEQIFPYIVGCRGASQLGGSLLGILPRV